MPKQSCIQAHDTIKDRNYERKMQRLLEVSIAVLDSWKSMLEKCQALTGPCHSIVVTKSGAVYTFRSSTSRQIDHGTTKEKWHPISNSDFLRHIHGKMTSNSNQYFLRHIHGFLCRCML